MTSDTISLQRHRTITVVAKPASSAEPASLRQPHPIFIVDDRALARECLSAAYQSFKSGRTIETFASVDEVLQRNPGSASPSLILYCFASEADAAGLEAGLETFAQAFPETPTVVLTDIKDFRTITRAFQAGTRAYIPSCLSLHIAMQAIDLVEAGGTYLPAELLLGTQPQPPQCAEISAATRELTPRQKAVLHELRKGKANKVIALALGMRESTVKVHVRNIMRRLNAHNRTEVTFMTHGLPEAPLN